MIKIITQITFGIAIGMVVGTTINTKSIKKETSPLETLHSKREMHDIFLNGVLTSEQVILQHYIDTKDFESSDKVEKKCLEIAHKSFPDLF